MGMIGEWVAVGDAARIAGRDKTTIRRWADQHLVTARRSATGHRQILLSSLQAVLSTGPRPTPNRVEGNAGRVMLERWFTEAPVLSRWAPDPQVPAATVLDWLARLDSIEDTVLVLRSELNDALDRAYDAADQR